MTTPSNILLVEDNPGDAFLVKELLQMTSLTIRHIYAASSLSAAVKVLENNPVNLVLLDLTLSDSSGMATFLTINRYTATIPVIILSGLDDKDTAIQAIAMGAQDFLLKGEFDEKLFDKTIRYSIERKHNLEELRVSNERYSLVSQATNDIVWDWDIISDKIYRSEEQFVKQLKFPAHKKDLGREFWLSIVHPNDQDVPARIMKIINATDGPNTFVEELRIYNGEGELRYIKDRGFMIRNAEGKVLRIIGAMQDITDTKKAEQELRKLSLIAKETVDSVIITDADEKIQWVNEAFERVTGYSFKEAIGKKPGYLLQGPNSSVEQKEYLKKQIMNRQPFHCEIVNYHKTGYAYWIEIKGQPVFDEEGELLYFFALQTDITERKEAETILKQSEEKYRSLFNHIPASVFIWRLADLEILEVNDTAASQYGYSREELLQLTTLKLRKLSDQQFIRNLANNVLKKEKYSSNRIWKHINKNKEEMYMQISSNRIDYNGVPAMMDIAIDITDKIKLEEELEQEKTKKEQEIKLAVVFAQENKQQEIGRELHDNVTQILATSQLFLGLLKSNKGIEDNSLTEANTLIGQAINEIRDLSHTLIAPAVHGLELLKSLENLLSKTATVRGLKVQNNTLGFYTKGLSNQLNLTIYRIVQEQMNNILKHADATFVQLTLTRSKEGIQLRIKDNGKGFDPARVVDGVGLLNIKNRASLHHGQVLICSETGKGCELAVTFKQDSNSLSSFIYQ